MTVAHYDADPLRPENCRAEGWYFSDEADMLHGPYATKEAADYPLLDYQLWLKQRKP